MDDVFLAENWGFQAEGTGQSLEAGRRWTDAESARPEGLVRLELEAE